ncbi:MAG: PEP-CTERM sorting domain-containing protein [Fimbriimonas sp.]
MKTQRALLLCLAVVAAAQASAQNSFDVSISPTNTDINNVKVVFGFNDGTDTVGFPVAVADSVVAGTTTSSSFSTNADPATFNYGVLASYGATGVSVGVRSNVASSLVGKSWESIFTNPLYSESWVRTALDTDNYASQYLFSTYLAGLEVDVAGTNTGILAPIGEEVTILNFSNASLNGSVTVESVPEPASMAALAGGCAWLLRRRKR